MKSVTPSDLRSIFPKQVPKDIITLVDEYIFNDIRGAVKDILYRNIILEINSNLLPESYFVEKITQGFVEKIGNCFEEFLENYQSLIKEYGSDALYDVRDNVTLLIYKRKSVTNLSYAIFVFLKIVLTRMGYVDGHFPEEHVTLLLQHLDSLKS